MKRLVFKVLALMLLCAPLTVIAQSPSVRLESRVTGNRELPKVTYILPWRQPAEMDFSWEPEAGIAGDLFRPLRRDEYLRQLRYQHTLVENANGALSPATDNLEERGN